MYTSDILKLVYIKNYFNLAKMFVLRLFNIAANQTECPKLELRSVIKFIMAEKRKQCEIFRGMCDMYGAAYFRQKDVYKLANPCHYKPESKRKSM